MSYLELKNLTKIFNGNVVAVNDFSLDIEKGEFIAFLGPSGCGKTTTLRLIAGLENVTRGSIILDGKTITDLPARHRNMSMIFQSYAVWPHMTVYDNIAYPLKLRKKNKQSIKETVEHVSNISGISDLLKRYPSQLSGGQRQRVAVARAIAVEPKVFLLDEPLSNLDAKLRVAMRTDLKRIHRELKSTSVFVTHDQAEAMSLADRIVVMNEGVIQQVGSPKDIYHNPETMFIAKFMGSPPSNFLHVKVEKQEGDIIVIHNKFTKRISGSVAQTLEREYVGKTVIFSVRPEDVMVIDKGGISVNATIVEPQGSHVIINTHIDDEPFQVVTDKLDITMDEKINIDMGKKFELFDQDTEQRIR